MFHKANMLFETFKNIHCNKCSLIILTVRNLTDEEGSREYEEKVECFSEIF